MAGTWTTEAADTNGARYYITAAYDSSANLTYAIDGYQSGGPTWLVGSYSHSSNAWSAETSDSADRYASGAAYDSSANLTYSIDGWTTVAINTVTAYSHGSNSWTTETSDSAGVRVYIDAAYDS